MQDIVYVKNCHKVLYTQSIEPSPLEILWSAWMPGEYIYSSPLCIVFVNLEKLTNHGKFTVQFNCLFLCRLYELVLLGSDAAAFL